MQLDSEVRRWYIVAPLPESGSEDMSTKKGKDSS